MRLLVFFDLPVETSIQKKSYRNFRKFLIKDGYLMLQNSVYAKLVINSTSANASIMRLRKKRPTEGLVQVLQVTEKQFASMEYIVGSHGSYEALDNMEDLVIL